MITGPPTSASSFGLGDAQVVARADQIAARLIELGLRAEHVQQRRPAHGVALLLDAQILLGRIDGGDLRRLALLGRPIVAERARQTLDRGQLRVAQRRLGVRLRHLGLRHLLLALELREHRQRHGQAQRPGVGEVVPGRDQLRSRCRCRRAR